METGQTIDPANPNPISLDTLPRPLWHRQLAIATAVVFAISSIFPTVSGLSKDTSSFPKWWGPLDVGIAFFLAALAFAVMTLAYGKVTKQAEDTSFRAYRVLLHALLAWSVVYMLAGDRIVWANCLTGFAWRAWLLLYGLPAWLTVFGATVGPSGSPQRREPNAV